MAKKTNRTSHVMDLLTNGASGEAPAPAQAPEAPAAGQEKKSDVQSHTVTPAKVTVVDEGSINDRVSQEILGKLTEELDAEKAAAAPQPEATPETAQANVPETSVPGQDTPQEAAPAQDIAPQDAAQAQDPAPQDAAQAQDIASQGSAQAQSGDSAAAPGTVSEPAPADSSNDSPKDASEASQGVSEAVLESSSQGGQAQAKKASAREPHPIIPGSHFENTTVDREYRFINVMEHLLMRQDLESVLKQHNVCTCHRCMSDVCALSLTGLPAKYVVTSKDSVSPLLSYYENKYKIPVLTELIKACNRVRENPHHNRPE